jgi:hypothetical protein
MKRNWSFSELKRTETLWGPHGYHRYPAKFIPQLVRRIIDDYSVIGSLVADPFLGSATTGIEALRGDRRFWGADINPVALFISRAKCTPIPPKLLSVYWEKLENSIIRLKRIGRRTLKESEKAQIREIDIARANPEERFAYWFPIEHAKILEQLLQLIKEVPDQAASTFFLCGFSNILRGSSIWLSGSTKPQKDLTKYLADPVDSFLRQSRDMIRRNVLYWEDLLRSNLNPNNLSAQCTIDLHDARHLPLKDGIVDLIVTSPPYATCYQYLDIHQLTQLWFERYEVLPKVKLHYDCIGELRVPKDNKPISTTSTGSKIADIMLLNLYNISMKKDKYALKREVNALRNYFLDMGTVVKEFARVIAPERYLVFIIGDSYKRGITIPTTEAICEMAAASEFQLEDRIVRKVPVRVLVITRNKATGRFSSRDKSDVQAYPEENILIFRRPAKTVQREGLSYA